MADNRTIYDNGCKEAVCIDAGRVYDSCGDKDCLEDLRVLFSEQDQALVDNAVSVRTRSAEVLTTCIDVEALPFNRGYYACDLTFVFRVNCELYTGRCTPSTDINGIAVFQKKVILYGSEGNVKVFSSEYAADASDAQGIPARNMPRCYVQVADPIILNSRLVDINDGCRCDCCCAVPEAIANGCGGLVDPQQGKAVLVTLGIFTIVQLVRNVQMLVPVYDFCVPEKECTPTTDNPCELFRRMCFPVDEFFPPKQSDNCGCGSGNTGEG